MIEYQLTDRKFSREWRRSKRYSRNELRWLARKRGLELRERGGVAQVIEPGTRRVVANFAQVKQAAPVPESRPDLKLFAALAAGRIR